MRIPILKTRLGEHREVAGTSKLVIMAPRQDVSLCTLKLLPYYSRALRRRAILAKLNRIQSSPNGC